jgi:hypothetical protein
MARGSAATSGTARLSRPARAATNIPLNTTSAANEATDTHPVPTRSKSGLSRRNGSRRVPVTSRSKATVGQATSRSKATVGQATSPAGRQLPLQQVDYPRGQPEEQAGEDDEPECATHRDAPHHLLNPAPVRAGVRTQATTVSFCTSSPAQCATTMSITPRSVGPPRRGRPEEPHLTESEVRARSNNSTLARLPRSD